MIEIERQGLTFDDVLLVPAHSAVLPSEVSLRTRVSRGIELQVPLLSAAMDTVTEARLAIAMAQLGGIGIIHKNNSVAEQMAQVRAVKKYESGVVTDPITIGPDNTVAELVELAQLNRVSGMPVVDGRSLVGIVTARDFRHETNMLALVSDIMTPHDQLVTVSEDTGTDEITRKLHEHRLEKLLIVNDDFQLIGLVTLKDIKQATLYPNACKDKHGQLRVGAAIGTGAGTEERLAALVEAGVDLVILDSAHGHSSRVLEGIARARREYPGLQIIGGNVATAEGARALVEAGADAVKVGIGPGSICTTRIVTGVGVPQLTAISEVATEVGNEVPVIADGGIRYSGDIAKALAVGANCTMLGGLFAGTSEAPGEIELYQGRSYKTYRGMGSLGTMAGEQC